MMGKLKEMFFRRRWFRKKIIIRRPVSPDDISPWSKWMGNRYQRIFLILFVVLMGILPVVDYYLNNLGIRDTAMFDGGIIGVFGMLMLWLRYLKPKWFKD